MNAWLGSFASIPFDFTSFSSQRAQLSSDGGHWIGMCSSAQTNTYPLMLVSSSDMNSIPPEECEDLNQRTKEKLQSMIKPSSPLYNTWFCIQSGIIRRLCSCWIHALDWINELSNEEFALTSIYCPREYTKIQTFLAQEMKAEPSSYCTGCGDPLRVKQFVPLLNATLLTMDVPVSVCTKPLPTLFCSKWCVQVAFRRLVLRPHKGVKDMDLFWHLSDVFENHKTTRDVSTQTVDEQ